MTSVNTPSRLNDEQMAVIRQGTVKGREWKEVYDNVCAIRPATQSVVRETMEKVASESGAKSEIKREGTRLVREFLHRAKEGADVDDMAAVLENAVYHDLLRRYADAGDPLVSMTMDQLLKLDLSYRSARLSKTKHEDAARDERMSKLAARVCMETLDRIVSLTGDRAAREQVKKTRGPLIRWARKKYGTDNIEQLEKDRNEIERLSSLIRRRRSGGCNTREAGHGKPDPLAG